MNTAIYENLNKVAQSSYESMKALYTLQSKLAEQITEQQMALTSLGLEYVTRQMQLATEAKGYKEVLSGQTEIANDISSKMQGIARSTIEVFNESRDELNNWFEKCAKEAEKGIKEASKVVPVSKAA